MFEKLNNVVGQILVLYKIEKEEILLILKGDPCVDELRVVRVLCVSLTHGRF